MSVDRWELALSALSVVILIGCAAAWAGIVVRAS